MKAVNEVANAKFQRKSVATEKVDLVSLGIDTSVLSKTEEFLLRTALVPKGTPFIMGAPGSAKTAILESIAAKIGYEYVDLRLPTMDEVEMGIYPLVSDETFEVNGVATTIKQVTNAYPRWVGQTFRKDIKGTIIVFEELNRAQKPVLDASMGVLLEKRVGDIELPQNCLLFATGNMGDADGTDVQELDTAMMSGRLIPLTHELYFNDWMNDWAIHGNIHPDIVSFLKENPSKFYPELKKQMEREQGGILITGRSWSMLSSQIVANFGMESTIADYGWFLDKIGRSLVAQEYAELRKFLHSQNRLTIKGVINGAYTKKDYTSASRENKSAVISEIEAVRKDMDLKQFKNLVKFLQTVNKDELVNVLTKELDITAIPKEWGKILATTFADEIQIISEKL